ncbi:hypothetical protein JXA32_02385 [Candidatus Sumerlaeota bacterium]|nr:hypothetical protein [Candidatus Sumerlaeota bacterium]
MPETNAQHALIALQILISWITLNFLPGFFIIRLILPKRPVLEQCLWTVPLNVLLISLLGQALALIQAPFNLTAYWIMSAPVAAICIAMLVTKKRRDAASTPADKKPDVDAVVSTSESEADHEFEHQHSRLGWRFSLAALPMLIVLEIAVFGQLFGSHTDDAVNHAEWTYYIVKNQTVQLPSFYPFSFHAMLALEHRLTHAPIPIVMMQSAVLYISLIPLWIVFLALSCGVNRAIAFWAGIFACCYFSPYDTFFNGGWCVAIGEMFVLGALTALAMASRLASWRYWILFCIQCAATFYMHSSDILTIMLLGPAILLTFRAWLNSSKWKLAALTTASAVVLLLLISPLAPSILAISHAGVYVSAESKLHEIVNWAPRTWESFSILFWSHPFGFNSNYFLPAAAVLGFFSIFTFKPCRLFLAFHLIVTNIILLTAFEPLQPLLVKIHPWPTAYRLIFLWLISLSVLAAAGPFWLQRITRAPAFSAYILLFIAAGGAFYFNSTRSLERIGQYRKAYTPWTDSDLMCMRALNTIAPPGSTVLTNYHSDNGCWLLFYTNCMTSNYFMGYASTQPDFTSGYHYLRSHFITLGVDERAKAIMERFNIRYAYLPSWPAAMRPQQISATTFDISPWFERVFHSNHASIYKYTPENVEEYQKIITFDIGSDGDGIWRPEGFHAPQYERDTSVNYRWTCKHASLVLPNPGPDYHHIAIGFWATRDYTITINGEQTTQKFPHSSQWAEITIPLPADRSAAEYRIDIDAPAAEKNHFPGDNRILGIAIDWFALME